VAPSFFATSVTSVSKRVEALQDHAKLRATSRAPADCADACSASDDTSVNKATDDVKTTHALGAMPDLDEFGNPVLFARSDEGRLRNSG
jgi:hypothetical protein